MRIARIVRIVRIVEYHAGRVATFKMQDASCRLQDVDADKRCRIQDTELYDMQIAK